MNKYSLQPSVTGVGDTDITDQVRRDQSELYRRLFKRAVYEESSGDLTTFLQQGMSETSNQLDWTTDCPESNKHLLFGIGDTILQYIKLVDDEFYERRIKYILSYGGQPVTLSYDDGPGYVRKRYVVDESLHTLEKWIFILKPYHIPKKIVINIEDRGPCWTNKR
jgi:hypothetical protein